VRAIAYEAIGGFADLWLYSDRESTYRLRPRDLGLSVVAAYACDTCGADVGEPCRRRTIAGVLDRRRPHFGRSKPGRNRPYRTGAKE
jgi:hypothetical protein